MSAASSPGPQNLVLLAALGIGAYWFLSRRAVASQAAPVARPGGSTGTNAGTIDAAGRLINAVRGLFGGSDSSTFDGRAALPWDVTPSGVGGPTFNNPSAYVSGGLDGIAANPVQAAPYDTFLDPAQYGLA